MLASHHVSSNALPVLPALQIASTDAWCCRVVACAELPKLCPVQSAVVAKLLQGGRPSTDYSTIASDRGSYELPDMGGGRRSLDTILGPRRSMDARLSTDSNASEAAAMVRPPICNILGPVALLTSMRSAWCACCLLSEQPQRLGV